MKIDSTVRTSQNPRTFLVGEVYVDLTTGGVYLCCSAEHRSPVLRRLDAYFGFRRLAREMQPCWVHKPNAVLILDPEE